MKRFVALEAVVNAWKLSWDLRISFLMAFGHPVDLHQGRGVVGSDSGAEGGPAGHDRVGHEPGEHGGHD
eukprot:scaffold449_cov241-Pinguiococcus_pyrenoidosus.AAC.4